MIVGSGDIARALEKIDTDRFLFFASGVSNSQETRNEEYQREIDLLRMQSRSWHLVYFSSLSIFYSHTRYTEHKRRIETILKARFPNYTIVRLGNITWGDNPNTLINYLKGQMLKGEKLDIQDTERYICDLDEFLHWMRLIPDMSCEMNIPGKRMSVYEVVRKYVGDNSLIKV